MLDPVKSLQDRAQFLLALNNRDALLPRERQRRFLDREGWTAYSGPAIAELLEQFVTHNRMLEGGFVIDDRLVTLADIELPVLTFVGTRDTIGHPDAVRAIRRAAPRATVYEMTLQSGHFGLVVGSTATEHSWPAVAGWVHWRDGTGERPDDIVMADTVEPGHAPRPAPGMAAIAQATELGVGVGRIVVRSARRAGNLVRGVAREAPTALPRLSRLEQLDPSTRISLGLLMDEHAHRTPSDIAFLFGDRAHRQGDVKGRIDNVVKGLVSIGVRHGDRVGILMNTRPSAFTLVAAISRLGATSVLIRPDGDIAREICARPCHLGHQRPGARRRRSTASTTCAGPCSAAAGEWRELHPGVIDMERIDPDDVSLPAWYTPNPHRSSDVAFVLFTGEGQGTKALQITNRRWALSALGTASAAALRTGDTVFSTTPMHHTSALLMSVGGAVASGARFALASCGRPGHVLGGGAPLRRHPRLLHLGLAGRRRQRPAEPGRAAPPDPAVHRLRHAAEPLEAGDRALPGHQGARVLRLGRGRDHPGQRQRPQRRVDGASAARYGRGPGGGLRPDAAPAAARLGRPGPRDGAGRGRPAAQPRRPGRAERGRAACVACSRAGDAWRSSGDLFLRDDQGDLWLAGPVSEIVDTADGPALPSGARFALGDGPGRRPDRGLRRAGG